MELKATTFSLFCCCFIFSASVLESTEVRDKHGASVDHLWECVGFRDAFYYAVHDYVIPTLYGVKSSDAQQVAVVKQKIKNMIGVNVDSLQDIQRVACQVVGIATIGELSEILQLDYDYVRELYQVSVAMINAAPDGVENYMKSWQVTVLLADFFRNTQYPNWPLGVTMVDSFYMTWGLIRVYGPEFLQTFQPWETMHVDAYKFITALTDATSIDEFQKLAELSDSMVHAIVSIADKTSALDEEGYQQFLRSGNAYAKFLQVSDQLGLLHLKEGNIKVVKSDSKQQEVEKPRKA